MMNGNSGEHAALTTTAAHQETTSTSFASSLQDDSNNDEQYAILFVEHDEAFKCIAGLSSSSDRDEALARFRNILDKYLECPSLLDPSLESMVVQLSEPIIVQQKLMLPQQQQQKITTTTTSEDCGSDNSSSLLSDKGSSASSSSSISSSLPYYLSALYSICKVRGRKRVQKFLSHNVQDVTLVFQCLHNSFFFLQTTAKKKTKTQCNNKNNNDPLPSSSSVEAQQQQPPPPLWESMYILWMWMSMLSLIPFDCHVFMEDSVLKELFQMCQDQLCDPGPVREAAAVCYASWMGRPDLQKTKVPEFVQYAKDILEEYYAVSSTNNNPDLFRVLGVLQTVTNLLKGSSLARDQLVGHLRPLWGTCRRLGDNSNKNGDNLLLRRLLVKFWTRMGCAYLPPRIAKWRYQRGKRSLFDSSSVVANPVRVAEDGQSTDIIDDNVQKEEYENNNKDSLDRIDVNNDDELFHVPDEVEEAMGRIIDSLSHRSTIVRWSAAKGVGRVTERLPNLCGEDVLDAILELFEDPDMDQLWHGACLALAELARRGLLLPNRLSDVVPLIVRAVHYDRRQGQSSVGAHVRDAACYTYWAFARAYAPAVLQPYLVELSEAIVLTSLFDREVNCRRAASAAFQEAVGRQGATNVPHGIEILTTADYFSLGNRTESYLSIAANIAAFEEHRRPIIRHLYTVKLSHWDAHIRRLASQSLRNLVALDFSYFCSSVVPGLLERCVEKDLNARHGALLGVAEILLALSEVDRLSLLSKLVNERLVGLVPDIEKRRLYRGRGGEIMRSAVCRFIECLSLAKLPLSVKEQVRLLDSVDANLTHPSEIIQQDACQSLEALMSSYFPVGEKGPSQRLQKRVVDKFVESAYTSDNPATTRGYTLALGYLPAKLVAPSSAVLSAVVSCLIKLSNRKSLVGGESDAETRRNSLSSLIRLVKTVNLPVKDDHLAPVLGLESMNIFEIMTAFLDSLEDYNTDRRGDVGSWCRIVAMEGATTLLVVASQWEEDGLQLCGMFATQVVGRILKQLGQKLDVVRQKAGKCLEVLLLATSPGLQKLSQKDALVQIFGLSESNISLPRDWCDPSSVFPLLVKVAVLENDVFFDNVVAGFVASVGGLSEGISKYAFETLLGWSKEGGFGRQRRLGNSLLALLEVNSGNGRMVVPILKTFNLLLNHGCFDEEAKSNADFSRKYLRRIQLEAASNDIARLFALVDATTALLLVQPREALVVHDALAFLCQTLAHRFPRVRSYAAQQFYLFLLESRGEGSEITDLMLNTPWPMLSDEDRQRFSQEAAKQLGVMKEKDACQTCLRSICSN